MATACCHLCRGVGGSGGRRVAAEAELDGWKRAVRSASLVSMSGERQRSKMSFHMKKGVLPSISLVVAVMVHAMGVNSRRAPSVPSSVMQALMAWVGVRVGVRVGDQGWG